MGNTPDSKLRNQSSPGYASGQSVTIEADELGRDLSSIVKNVSEERSFRALSEAAGDQISTSQLPTVFKWAGGGKEVFLTGSFNSWQAKIPLVKSQENFYTIVELPQGHHEYKFIVDGMWMHDTKQPTAPNDMGSMNNVLEVKASDFEVFEALAVDIAESAQVKESSYQSEVSERMRSRSGSPPGQYTTVIPTARSAAHRPPPALPQQLLQVILNRPTDARFDPNLLPEPDHVMLNHLYALSIKDGVVVLSTIHRYRKKFVTTVMYKPCD